jgi:hypothetical protein
LLKQLAIDNWLSSMAHQQLLPTPYSLLLCNDRLACSLSWQNRDGSAETSILLIRQRCEENLQRQNGSGHIWLIHDIADQIQSGKAKGDLKRWLAFNPCSCRNNLVQ